MPHRMKMHEVKVDGFTTILRVPGGWIYMVQYNDDHFISQFVPYSEEFDPLVRKSHPSGRHTGEFDVTKL